MTTAELPIVSAMAGFRPEVALFTTYTLSLAWFETYLLRPLERAGLRRAALLADPVGVTDAGRERLVAGPGVRYALEAVRAAGSFHPKVAVLWAPARLLLAVGSGNLTLPGMQRNLEVWEVFVAGVEGVPQHRRLSAEVAGGAARFVADLANRLQDGTWARRLVSDTAAALADWEQRLAAQEGVKWVDSLRQPIGQQIADLMPSTNGAQRLGVLSPFFDARGEAVRHLAHELGCAEVDLYHVGGRTRFPLAEARAWGVPRLTARALDRDPKRALHAKVLSIQDTEKAWVLSGSANATWQALWTTNNVEACILRELPRAVLDGEIAEPEQSSSEVTDLDVAPLVILSARATAKVNVRLAWRGKGAPPPTITLVWLDVDAPTMTTNWPADDTVSLPLPTAFDNLRPRPLRLQITSNQGGRHHEARAWVAFEDWLDAGPTWRAAATAWMRLLDRYGVPDDDDATLLRMFAEQHSRSITYMAGSPHPGPRADATTPHADRPIPIELLDALSRRPALPGGSGGAADRGAAVDAVRRAMIQAFRCMDHTQARLQHTSDESD